MNVGGGGVGIQDRHGHNGHTVTARRGTELLDEGMYTVSWIYDNLVRGPEVESG